MVLGGAVSSETRLPVAEMLVRKFEAELVLLSILPPEPAAADRAISPRQAHLTAYLEMMSARLHAQGLHVHGLLHFAASVTDVIVEEANDTAADLVILGISARSGLPRIFQPNVPDDVARRITCPVMLVQQTGRATREPVVRSFDADSARWGPLARWNLGIRPVSVARIVGSVGRADDIANGAALKSSPAVPAERRQRYQRVLSAMRSGVALPAVELYKLGSGYYIVDGNHRVAAARELGQADIDADVTEFVPLDDDAAQRVFAERRAFERHTGVREIESAHVPGTFPALSRLFDEFADDAALPDPSEKGRRWYNQIYDPLARAIAENDLLRHYPGEHTSDVVARLAGFRQHVARRQGALPDWPTVVEVFRTRKIPRDKKAVLGHAHSGRGRREAAAIAAASDIPEVAADRGSNAKSPHSPSIARPTA
jgi:nucleotide-binding universal stress UspA family protein